MNSKIGHHLTPWVAACVVAGAAAFYILKSQGDAWRPKAGQRASRPDKPFRLVPRATPAQEPLELQEVRATEHGRGRRARSPRQIPWRGWKDIVVRTLKKTLGDRLLGLAAEVAFYSLVALFPAIAAGVSIYALFADAGTIAKHLSLAVGVVPNDALEMLRDEITRIAAKSDGKLTFGFVSGLGVALWSANAGMKAMFDALNVIYDEQEKRGFVRLNLITLLCTICAIGAALLAVGAVVVLPLLLAMFGVTAGALPIISYVRWPLMWLLVAVGTTLLYRHGPDRRPAKWRWISGGSVVAALAWLAVSSLFSWYLASFANYNVTYGSLGAVVGLMMWMWLSAIAVLIGAELNSEIEHQTARDSTVGTEKPLGARGAVMADTIGAAQFDIPARMSPTS